GQATRAAKSGRNSGQGQGGRRTGEQQSGVAEEAGRPATVTVVDEDGSIETRDVGVGVSDRVTAAILSGLTEGEQVVAGTDIAGRGGRRGNGRGLLGGFR